MSTTIEKFAKQLHDNLEMVEERVKSLRDNIQSVPRQPHIEIQSKLDQAKANLSNKKREFEGYRAKLQIQFEEKESELNSNIEEWKSWREISQMEIHADNAENYAAKATYLAIATMEEAEKAILEAITARLDAEIAGTP
jgi:transcriptional regulator CtsR